MTDRWSILIPLPEHVKAEMIGEPFERPMLRLTSVRLTERQFASALRDLKREVDRTIDPPGFPG